MPNFLLIADLFILACIFWRCTAPPVAGKKETDDDTKKQIQDYEYHRYLAEVIDKLQQDPDFKKKVHNLTEDDIKAGKILEHVDLLDHDVRRKLDEVKRNEIKYQHELINQKRLHMTKEKRNEWNPVHHENNETFESEDLKLLIRKHHRLMEETDQERRKQFKAHLMGEAHKRRTLMKNMTDSQKVEFMKKYKESQHKDHEKMHAPGHKAQLMETWEKEDNLDPEAFDEKTMFHLHDKNGDGYLDVYELGTLFLHDINKVYNDSDPETDIMHDEEIERMREGVMASLDKDQDGLVSMDEFMNERNDPDYEKDDEWKPIEEDEEYTDEEMDAYEKEHPDQEYHEDEHEDGNTSGHHEPPKDEHEASLKDEHREPPKDEHHEPLQNEHHEPPKDEHHEPLQNEHHEPTKDEHHETIENDHRELMKDEHHETSKH